MIYKSCYNTMCTRCKTIGLLCQLWLLTCFIVSVRLQTPSIQTCEHCRQSLGCAVTQQPNRATWQQCLADHESAPNQMIVYNRKTTSCSVANCTGVLMDVFSMTFRQTFNQDCLHVRIFEIPAHVGTCSVVYYFPGPIQKPECFGLCLDTAGCRGVSYDTVNKDCTLHACHDVQYSVGTRFMKKICLNETDLTPVKPYQHVCHNCYQYCAGLPIATEPDVLLYTGCNATCHHCDAVQYHPQTSTCYQRQCDFVMPPFIFSDGYKIIRKSPDPDCTEYEVVLYGNGLVPDCEPFAYTEGLGNIWYRIYCFRVCLDMPGCRYVTYGSQSTNCTYHSCNAISYQPNSTDMTTVQRKCKPECSLPTIQTCTNCGVGTACGVPFKETSLQTAYDCLQTCSTQDHCKVLLYENGSCSYYQCTQPDQGYQSTLYRKTCNDDDCPMYEMYIVSGTVGTCDVITNMTEDLVSFPHQCYERCLDTPGCRGVTYTASNYKCRYHTCDCSEAGGDGTFMWRYCLPWPYTATILTNSSDVSSYPRAVSNYTCQTGLTTTTTLPTSPGTPDDPVNIYLMPCLCDGGTSDNLTEEERLEQIVQNLTVDASQTSAAIRRRTCATDDRPSAAAVGVLGIGIFSFVGVLILAADAPSIFLALCKLMKSARKSCITTVSSEVSIKRGETKGSPDNSVFNKKTDLDSANDTTGLDAPSTSTDSNVPKNNVSGSPSMNIISINNNQDLRLVNNTADLSSTYNKPDIASTKASSDICPTNESLDISPTNNSPNIGPVNNGLDVGPTNNSLDISSLNDSPAVSPTNNSRDASPTNDSLNISLTNNSPDISPIHNSSDVSPVNESPDISPTNSRPDISPPNNSPDVSQTNNSSDINPTNSSPDISQVNNTLDISGDKFSPKLCVTSNMIDISESNYSLDLEATNTSIDLNAPDSIPDYTAPNNSPYMSPINNSPNIGPVSIL